MTAEELTKSLHAEALAQAWSELWVELAQQARDEAAGYGAYSEEDKDPEEENLEQLLQELVGWRNRQGRVCICQAKKKSLRQQLKEVMSSKTEDVEDKEPEPVPAINHVSPLGA